jgi:hypothetical protein
MEGGVNLPGFREFEFERDRGEDSFNRERAVAFRGEFL